MVPIHLIIQLFPYLLAIGVTELMVSTAGTGVLPRFEGAITTVLDPNFCVTVPGAADTAEQRTQLRAYHDDARQHWRFTAERTIQNVHSGLCLDATDATQGVATIHRACSPSTSSQRWSWNETGKTLSPDAAPDKCLEVLGFMTMNGVFIAVRGCWDQDNQRWILRPPSPPPLSPPSRPPRPPTPPPSPSPPHRPPTPPWVSTWQAKHASVWDRCPNRRCLVIVGIMSAAHLEDGRKMLRDTTLHPDLTPEGVAYIFILSRPRIPHDDVSLQREFQQHQDMLLLDGLECDPSTFTLCHVKTFHFFQWVARGAGVDKTEYWVKTDMDTMVNLYALKLHSLRFPSIRVFWGRWVWPNDGEHMGIESAFFNGPFYLFSSDVATFISETPLVNDPKHLIGKSFWNESRPEDQRTSQIIAEYIPRNEWLPALQCEVHEPLAHKGLVWWNYRINNHTVAVHQLKSAELWHAHLADLRPIILTWKAFCEPARTGDVMRPGLWTSRECIAMLPPVQPCKLKRCPAPRRGCPHDLDLEHYEVLRRSMALHNGK